MLPSLFVSHGAPSLLLTEAPAKHFLASLPALLPEQPRAVLVVSAHWETQVPTVSGAAVLETIHDFGGFPRALYDMRYPATGDAALSARVTDLVSAAGLAVQVDPRRGLDHGAWVPLKLMYPGAEIPVVQLSLQYGQGAEYHLALGRALAPLRQEGVLVLGSGSFTHDLSSFRSHRDDGDYPQPEWVSSFADWFEAAMVEGQIDKMADYRRLAPNATRNHPTEEHLMPLFVALGAAGANAKAERLHASVTHAILRMDAYAFTGAA